MTSIPCACSLHFCSYLLDAQLNLRLQNNLSNSLIKLIKLNKSIKFISKACYSKFPNNS